MSKYMLDVVRNLIKVRDALDKMETDIEYFRRVIDGSVNEITDWLKDQNIITVKDDDDASESDSSEVEQPVVEQSSQKGRTGADGDDDEGRESVQD